jgi:hypothetical protein
MFSDRDLHALLDYSSGNQVLSVYLDTDPTKTPTEAAKIKFRNLLKTVELKEDVQVVEEFLDLEYDWAAKGLAIFSDQSQDFFQTYSFNLSVPNKVYVGKKPTVRPLVRLIDAFTGWGVVLVDKQGARLFSFDFGELSEIDAFSGDDVKQTKRGGGNAMPGRMGGANASANVENIIDQNIKDVVELATTFFKKQHIRRIMICGTDVNIALFKDELPKSWQSLVIGEFPMSMTASYSDIHEQVLDGALAAKRKRNQVLVQQAQTQAAKGANGVIGLNDTLGAIREGRVNTLLVMEDFEQAGFHCNGCGYLSTQELVKCPFCGGTFDRIDAAVEMAVQETLRNNAEVKVITENDLLVEIGSIAAILRY